MSASVRGLQTSVSGMVNDPAGALWQLASGVGNAALYPLTTIGNGWDSLVEKGGLSQAYALQGRHELAGAVTAEQATNFGISLLPGERLLTLGKVGGTTNALDGLVWHDTLRPVKTDVKLAYVEVDVAKASKGTPEYKILNEPPPNSHVNLSNGTEFRTNSSGYVDEITFSPALEKGTRDARQTAVGKEGLPTDVGGHIRGCQFGGTCDRFNLFPQDGNFNNSAYKRWEIEIKNGLKSGDQVGPVTVRFSRADSGSPRPDSLVIDYSINGIKMRKSFKNEAGQ